MHIVDFLVNLGAKFAPIDQSSLKTLQIQLTDQFNKVLNNYNNKMDTNIKLEGEIEQLNTQAEQAKRDGDDLKFSDVAYRMRELEEKKTEPSLVEKGVNFFNKPLVKFGLMIAFGLLMTFITKRLLSKKSVEEDEPDDMQPPVPPQYGWYPPQGFPQWPQQQGGRR